MELPPSKPVKKWAFTLSTFSTLLLRKPERALQRSNSLIHHPEGVLFSSEAKYEGSHSNSLS